MIIRNRTHRSLVRARRGAASTPTSSTPISADIVRRLGLTVTLRDNLAATRTPTFVELSHIDVASDIRDENLHFSSSTCPEGQIPGHVDEKWSLLLMRTYNALDDPADGDGIFLPIAAERRDLDVLSGLGSLDDQAGADVYADVTWLRGRAVRAGCEQQISWLELAV
jgi:hypothetical protein